MPIPPWGSAPGSSSGAVSSVSNSDGTLTISPTTGSVVASIATSAALPGSPTTTTQTAGDNSTKIATDAFVTTAVNNAISGVNPAVAVSAATTSASNTSGFTYSNGVSGVGATLTQNSAAVYTVDGFTFSTTTQRLLVKNDTQSPSGAFNGIYLCTTVGTSLIPAVFTRALDYDTPSDINNTGAIPVISGTVNGSTSWVETANVTTVGTSPLAFTEFTLNPTTLMTTTTYDPAAIAQQVVGTTATQALTNKTYNGLTVTSSTGTLTIANGKTATANNSLTFAGTDSTTMTFPGSSDTVAGLATANTFTNTVTIAPSGTVAGLNLNVLSGVSTLATFAQNASGTKAQFAIQNSATVSSTNIASFYTQANTSTQIRTVFQFDTSFSTTTDASRTSFINIQGADAGSFTSILTFTGRQATIPGTLLFTNNAITASSNAATVPITFRINTVTNNSAATLTVTLATSGATNRQLTEVLILDSSAAAQTITWVNTENSTVSAPTTSNGSTTLPISVLFQYNTGTSLWRTIAVA